MRTAKPAALGAGTLGKKGQETRRKLMDAAALLLGTTRLREMRAADISKKAGLSVGAFYIYFENVEAIALALAHDVAEQAQALIGLLEEDWPSPEAAPAIRRFVRAYFGFWDEHGAVLRVRNLAADEGDVRFLDARLRMSVPLHRAMATKIAEGCSRGLVQSDGADTAMAAMAIGSIDRVASFYHYVDTAKYSVTREQLVAAGTRLIRSVTIGEGINADDGSPIPT